MGVGVAKQKLRTLDIIVAKSLGLVFEPFEVSLDRSLVESSPSLVFDLLVVAHFVNLLS